MSLNYAYTIAYTETGRFSVQRAYGSETSDGIVGIMRKLCSVTTEL